MLSPHWQSEWAGSFTRVGDLLDYLGLPAPDAGLSAATERFAFRVPRAYADRMEKGNAQDPLLRQVLPVGEELLDQPGYSADPVGDAAAAAAPGVLHKYHGRALLVVTGACAINCRYCFRREFPYDDRQLSRRRQSQALRYLEENPDVDEAILSGGDPLALSDERLAELTAGLAAIPHLRRLRIHTRLPVVLPSRMTPGLIAAVAGTRLKPVVVIHVNHPNELDSSAAQALSSLRTVGVQLLNQSVLLRGVNDSDGILAALSEALFDCGVLPYYLHMLDKARGVAHFSVEEQQARSIHESLRRRLPGYLVPRLVREDAGSPYKTLL